jgi:hypothetical protein
VGQRAIRSPGRRGEPKLEGAGSNILAILEGHRQINQGRLDSPIVQCSADLLRFRLLVVAEEAQLVSLELGAHPLHPWDREMGSLQYLYSLCRLLSLALGHYVNVDPWRKRLKHLCSRLCFGPWRLRAFTSDGDQHRDHL